MKQTVLITGASSGFGRTTAGVFAANGWNVVATMRRPDAGGALAGADGVLVARLDVQDPVSIRDAIDAGLARFGRIDAVINNAGFGLFGVFESTPRAKVLEQFEVNVFGAMDVTRAILPHFRERRAGVLVNVSSGAGVFGLPLMSLYCASKFALEGFSEALMYELAPLGVTVKIVEPGGVLSTGFVARNAAEAGGVEPPADYRDVLSGADAVFGRLRSQRLATEGHVAGVIYAAATDGTDQLRYVATDDIQPRVKARRETSEPEYMAFMRSLFDVRQPRASAPAESR